jgi:hypothetical protein
MSNLTALENRVLEMLLHGDDETLSVFRQQANEATVLSRQLTGVGFFTKFAVRPQAPRVEGRPTFKFGDVNGIASNVRHGLGFLLYIEDGVISALEGYTYDEPWPDEPHDLSLTYVTGQDRDLRKLKAHWAAPSIRPE